MVARLVHDGDVAVTMGAGNVDDAASVILRELAADRVAWLAVSLPGAFPRPAPEMSVTAKLLRVGDGSRPEE